MSSARTLCFRDKLLALQKKETSVDVGGVSFGGAEKTVIREVGRDYFVVVATLSGDTKDFIIPFSDHKTLFVTEKKGTPWPKQL